MTIKRISLFLKQSLFLNSIDINFGELSNMQSANTNLILKGIQKMTHLEKLKLKISVSDDWTPLSRLQYLTELNLEIVSFESKRRIDFDCSKFEILPKLKKIRTLSLLFDDFQLIITDSVLLALSKELIHLLVLEDLSLKIRESGISFFGIKGLADYLHQSNLKSVYLDFYNDYYFKNDSLELLANSFPSHTLEKLYMSFTTEETADLYLEILITEIGVTQFAESIEKFSKLKEFIFDIPESFSIRHEGHMALSEALSMLTSLESLSLIFGNNYQTKAVFLDYYANTIKNLHNLKNLRLSISCNHDIRSAQINLLGECISNLKFLQDINIYFSVSGLTGNFFSSFVSQIGSSTAAKSLNSLSISFNCSQFQKNEQDMIVICDSLSNLTGLKELNLEINVKSEDEKSVIRLFESISNLKKIEILEIQLVNYALDITLTKKFIKKIVSLRDLKKLKLFYIRKNRIATHSVALSRELLEIREKFFPRIEDITINV